MAFDPYGPCPCGSGKKFKWCCQPIHVEIDKAFRQDEDGQHDMALRIMSDVVGQHPDNPEAWGRQAQLLYQNDRVEEAEKALDKALELNPNYPFGHFLRGTFRQYEGEMPGALVEFRKAAELYDPEAHDVLAQVYFTIGETEMRLNRPVAARAAFEIARRCRPSDENLRTLFNDLFGKESAIPAAARREYSYRSPSLPTASKESWDKALAGAATGKLSDALPAFEQITQEQPDHAAAWYNLGLTKAWLGDNRGAIDALEHYVTLEADEGQAAATWALAEVLSYGWGMEDRANWREYSVIYQIRDPRALVGLINEWVAQHRLVALHPDEEHGLLTGIMLDPQPTLAATIAPPKLAPFGANFMVAGAILRLWTTNAEVLRRFQEELQQKLGQALGESQKTEGIPHFRSICMEAIWFPTQPGDETEAANSVREKVQQYFEEKWIHRPMPSLGNVAPIDASGTVSLRKKLLGLILFLEECTPPIQPFNYDFNRLRRKLGLLPDGQPDHAGEPKGVTLRFEPDIAAMSAAELSALKVDDLADDSLGLAYQTALKLDARELAGHFARALVARPPRPEQPDRYPWYAHLMQLALAEGDTDTALNYLNEGERADCEQNQGHRRNDYELRRAQIHCKRGETDRAQEVFAGLIARAPSELRFRGSAAEAMLSARQPARALHFAEEGLAQARQQNNRDSEGYFMELVTAAQRQQ
jgi:tetratricopeptide (TPR) repeat protein